MAAKSTSVSAVAKAIFPKLGLSRTAPNPGTFSGTWGGTGPVLEKYSPIDGSLLARVTQASSTDYEKASTAAHEAFLAWRDLPAPKRGDVIRRYGEALRGLKKELGQLVSLEAGKII